VVTGAPAGVGRTALGAAMVRATESRRADRLFRDPFAAAFLAAAPTVRDHAARGAVAWVSGLSAAGAGFWAQVALRTRFFDDHLLDAAARGVRQVVLLAAGLDCRAYRLAWPPGVRLFEVDLPDVLAFKARVLAEREAVPRCASRLVPADLRGDWAAPLAAAGLRPDEPSAWLLEGLLIYLSADEVVRLLETLGGLSAAGSRVAFEYGRTDAEAPRRRAERLPALAEYAALWKGGLPDAPDWLASRGWRLERHDLAEVADRYGRALAGPSPGGLLTAARG
jgi:methyltransferase (TIGR00027 family)